MFLSFVVFGAVAALLSKPYLIPTEGNIKGVDVTLTWVSNQSAVTNLDWGLVDNSTAKILPESIKVTNINNTPVTLTLTTQNHSPSILDLTLTWDYNGTTLNPGDSIIITLTQTVTATGPFTYTTVITANEV